VRKPVGLRGAGLGSAWPLAALVVAAAAYLWEILTLSGIPVARDMQMFFVPQKHLLWEALSTGHVPLWTPYIGTGSPFLANVQSGVFYPPHWLYAILPFFVAFNLLVVFHFLLGGIFAWLLGRRLGWRPAPAYVAAVSWMLGGYFASLLNLVNALQGAAWAPALAWAVVRLVQRGSHRDVALLAAIAACGALAGEPQTFAFSVAVAGVVGLFEFFRYRSDARPVSRIALGGAIAVVVVAGIVMVQMLPTLELLRESGRGAGLTYPEAATYDLNPIRLIHFLVPPDYRDPQYAFGIRSAIGRGDAWLFSIYLGALWPILAWSAWRHGRRRAEVATWSVIAVACVAVALGDATPVYPWLYDHVPGVASFRFPEKYLFGTAFAAMLLAGWGAEQLIDGRTRRADRVAAATFGILLVVALVVFRLSRERLRVIAAGFGNDRMMSDFDYAFGVWSGNILKLVVLVGLALTLIWLYRRRTLSAELFGLLLAGLVTVDLAIAHRHLNPVVEPGFYEARPLLFRHVPIDEVRRDYRLRTSRFDSRAGTVPVIRGVPLEAQKWMWQQIVAPNIGQAWDVLQQDAWDAIKLGRATDERQIQRVLPEPERRWALLRLQSVKYVHTLVPVDPGADATEIPLDSLAGRLYRVERPLPRAYVVPAARRYDSPEAVINAVLAPDFDPRALVALVDSESPDASSGDPAPDPGFPGATIIEATDETVRIRLDRVPDDGSYLVLTDSHYPGWTATVDGESRPIELANFFFRAVSVRPGDHEVVFRYRSAPYERGRTISLLTLLSALALFGGAESRARRRTAAS